MKLIRLKIEACAMTHGDALWQVSRLMDMMRHDPHTKGYTVGDVHGNATGNFEEVDNGIEEQIQKASEQ